MFDYLEEEPGMANTKTPMIDNQQKWEDLTRTLNSMAGGIQKTTRQWYSVSLYEILFYTFITNTVINKI